MKVLETRPAITICPYCKSKLDIEPSDISSLSATAVSLGFMGLLYAQLVTIKHI